jgi:1-acyl-sn-glycerol-3-phosphate acyltransferase
VLFRPVVEGRDNLPSRGQVIIAANHLSFFDSIVIPLVAGRPVSFLAKAEYFTGRGIKGRIMRTFFRAIDAVPVDRDGHRAAPARDRRRGHGRDPGTVRSGAGRLLRARAPGCASNRQILMKSLYC